MIQQYLMFKKPERHPRYKNECEEMKAPEINARYKRITIYSEYRHYYTILSKHQNY